MARWFSSVWNPDLPTHWDGKYSQDFGALVTDILAPFNNWMNTADFQWRDGGKKRRKSMEKR